MIRFFAAGAALLVPLTASAHAFGQNYTLPLPQSFYITGGVGALLASFLVLAFFSSPQTAGGGAPARTLLVPAWISRLLAFSGIFALILTVTTGAFGSPFTFSNPAPTLFWIVLLLYFTYANAIVGGLWDAVNPFKRIVDWAFEGLSTPYTYPEKLGYIPALLFFYVLIWVELFSGFSGDAIILSIGLQAYFAITLAGCFAFGSTAWFRYCDFFTVFFRLVGLFAPFKLEGDTLSITRPGERLITERATQFSVLIFILFILSSTAFDGLRETSVWVGAILALPLSMSNYFNLLSQVALFLSPLFFFALYLLAIWLMKVSTRDVRSVFSHALRFAYSLVPIAIVYNFAHYFGLLYTDPQYLIAMASDPFGLGWNLFGTASYSPNMGLISAKTVWYVQLGSIVLGHIVAAYVAHRIALLEFKTRKDVLISQIPMMVLMVFYTAFGLWILSAPYAPGGGF